MKLKTSDLDGRQLDLAVAMLEIANKEARIYRTADCCVCINTATNKAVFLVPDGAEPSTPIKLLHHRVPVYSPSTKWSEAGPIIERERIAVFQVGGVDGFWRAGYSLSVNLGRQCDSGWLDLPDIQMRHESSGDLPLVAAMRAYVASRLGEEVELP